MASETNAVSSLVRSASSSHTPSTLVANSTNSQFEPELKGWLYKWTNYLKGYQKRYFVLVNGLLSYYRNPMEMSQNCRGAISLVSAMIHTEDSLTFVVSNGATQTFHLRASSEDERQKWTSALELAKVRAIRQMDADDDDFYDLQHDKNELQSILKTLQTKLDSLTAFTDVVVKRGSALQRALIELEQTENPQNALAKMKEINERATLFRITSSAMINASSEYLSCANSHSKKLKKLLALEHEARLKLEDLVEQLAKQHSHLEQKAIMQQQQVTEHVTATNSEGTEDDEFYDAQENVTTEFVISFPGKAHRIHYGQNNVVNPIQQTSFSGSLETPSTVENSNQRNSKRHRIRQTSNSVNDSGNSNDDDDEDDYSSEDNIEVDVVTRKSNDSKRLPVGGGDKTIIQSNNSSTSLSSCDANISNANKTNQNIRQRRKAIPPRPNHSLNLWSIMKNCIGKELTKIPMPVNFNEPLSMLQRMTEEFEYASLLHKAAKIADPLEQLVYVAAFSVTCYATTSNRTSKPFNPLLGETYECDRMDDLGWRCISEQVSHHPPMLAQYCDASDWVCWREFAMSSKFRGKYLVVNPIDISHLEFPASGNHYTWRKVATTVHNIIVGKLWVDNHGEMKIVNNKTGDTCHLSFHQYSYFSRDVPRKVTGVIVNSDGDIKWVLNGTWDNKMEAAKVVNSSQKFVKGSSKPVVETGTPKLIWKRVFPPAEFEKMYNMTELAVQLNEPEEGVAPTDSRLRMDQRLMEEGKWDEANEVKAKLEDKQRQTRRIREEEAEKAAAEGKPYTLFEPCWFKKNKDPVTGTPVHTFTNEYWSCKEKQDWTRCPNIYLDDE